MSGREGSSYAGADPAEEAELKGFSEEWGILEVSYPPPAWGSWLRHAEGQLQTDEKAGESRECSSFAGILSTGPVRECMLVRI